jgi:ubiquinone/menaquinone biosynthesis C-methylase UbiE
LPSGPELRSYYDNEASRYDESRGGAARADAAAAAIRTLLPAAARLVLDLAGGTGIVGVRLGRPVISLDGSPGMAAIAAGRLPGRVVVGDARRVPLADSSVDAVTVIWLLHMVADVPAVIADTARVLRPGGTLITTVNKAEAHHTDDVGAVLTPAWHAGGTPSTDDLATVTTLAQAHGMTTAGRTTFTGIGQSRSPAGWIAHLHDPTTGWLKRCGTAGVARLCALLAALPAQDRPRSEPEFQLVAFRR